MPVVKPVAPVADLSGVGRQRSEAERQVAELLRTARDSLELSVSFLTRMDGTTQTVEVIDSSLPLMFRDGATFDQRRTFCQAILDGRLPPVIPDVAADPVARALPGARFPRIRGFVSVPVTLSDGSFYGTFCAAGFSPNPQLSKRDHALMKVLATAAAAIIEPDLRTRERHAEISGRLEPVIAAGGPVMLFQPIIELATGRRVGAEALARFPAEWGKPPDVCFDEAHTIGTGIELELLAVRRAGEALGRIDGYLAVNASPETLLDPRAAQVLAELPLDRVLLELSEHDPVHDYPALQAAIGPLRRRGMRLAVDDVGSGYSSLRHIVLTTPDVIKLDRAIVTGAGTDPVITTLVHSLVEFGHVCGARVVAEGVETPAEAAALTAQGVDYGQGWLFGRPMPAEDLPDAVPRPAVAVG